MSSIKNIREFNKNNYNSEMFNILYKKIENEEIPKEHLPIYSSIFKGINNGNENIINEPLRCLFINRTFEGIEKYLKGSYKIAMTAVRAFGVNRLNHGCLVLPDPLKPHGLSNYVANVRLRVQITSNEEEKKRLYGDFTVVEWGSPTENALVRGQQKSGIEERLATGLQIEEMRILFFKTREKFNSVTGLKTYRHTNNCFSYLNKILLQVGLGPTSIQPVNYFQNESKFSNLFRREINRKVKDPRPFTPALFPPPSRPAPSLGEDDLVEMRVKMPENKEGYGALELISQSSSLVANASPSLVENGQVDNGDGRHNETELVQREVLWQVPML